MGTEAVDKKRKDARLQESHLTDPLDNSCVTGNAQCHFSCDSSNASHVLHSTTVASFIPNKWQTNFGFKSGHCCRNRLVNACRIESHVIPRPSTVRHWANDDASTAAASSLSCDGAVSNACSQTASSCLPTSAS